jgi:DNA-binding HxlR family transcriptional regulator
MARPYSQYCAMARALDVVGDRWTLLVVRELLTGPKRHIDLLGGLPGVPRKLLGDRLRALADAGVLERRELPPPAPAIVYELTDRGRALEPVLVALGEWGEPLLGAPQRDDDFRLRWIALGLRHRFNPRAAAALARVYELRVDDEVVHIEVGDGTVAVHDGAAARPDVVLETDRQTLLEWGTGRLNDRDALAAGLRIDGGARELARFRRLFDLTPREIAA